MRFLSLLLLFFNKHKDFSRSSVFYYNKFESFWGKNFKISFCHHQSLKDASVSFQCHFYKIDHNFFYLLLKKTFFLSCVVLYLKKLFGTKRDFSKKFNILTRVEMKNESQLITRRTRMRKRERKVVNICIEMHNEYLVWWYYHHFQLS